jgi:type VI secretion system protein ImpH
LGIPGSENHIATPVSRFLALLSVMRLPTRTAEGVTALVALLAPKTLATVTPHDPQPVVLKKRVCLSRSSRIDLKTRALLGRTGTDVNSQLLLQLYTEEADEARGWLPGGSYIPIFWCCCVCILAGAARRDYSSRFRSACCLPHS